MLELFMRCLAAEGKYIHSDNGGGDYYIEAEGNVLYILFEWSDGEEDWASNFDFLPTGNKPVRRILSAIKNNICLAAVPYKNPSCVWRVHRGFLRVWKDMRDKIELAVAKVLKENPRIDSIDIVGYSHGGAIALLAFEDMKYIYGDRYKIRGFGFASPRVIWGRVPKGVRERIEDFVTVRNGNDIVTRVPPKLLGYRDSGEVVDIGRKHIYTPIGAHYSFAYIEELREWELKNSKKSLAEPSRYAWRLDRGKS